MNRTTYALCVLLFEERLGDRRSFGLAIVAKYRRHAVFVAMILLQAAERGMLDDVLAELEEHELNDGAAPTRLRRLISALIGTPTERFLDRLFRSVLGPPMIPF